MSEAAPVLNMVCTSVFGQADYAAATCIFLITGDGGFAETCSTLRRLGYHVVVLRPEQHTPPALAASASVLESWDAIKHV